MEPSDSQELQVAEQFNKLNSTITICFNKLEYISDIRYCFDTFFVTDICLRTIFLLYDKHMLGGISVNAKFAYESVPHYALYSGEANCTKCMPCHVSAFQARFIRILYVSTVSVN